jgi:SOS-response transcriptional repressor LexA
MPLFTPTQGRYLSFIQAYTDAYGLPPSEADIAEALRVSGPSANQMVRTLEKKGLIEREAGVPRSIEIMVDPELIPEWKGRMVARVEKVWARSSQEADRIADAIIEQRRMQRALSGKTRRKPSR